VGRNYGWCIKSGMSGLWGDEAGCALGKCGKRLCKSGMRRGICDERNRSVLVFLLTGVIVIDC
jgi:hypothetical protein